MATFPIKQGDTSPVLRYLTPDGVDLTGATAVFNVRGLLNGAPATVHRLSPPTLQYAWQAGDTDAPPRVYVGEFVVTFPGGQVETFWQTQDGGRLAVHIVDRAISPPSTIIYDPGETPEPLTLTDAAGQPLDLTGATVTALVRVDGADVELPLTVVDPLLGEAWPAWGDLNLAPGTYSVRLRTVWPDATVDIGDDTFSLQVTA